ncbi:MAG TPA: DUF4142 domain-containing protein, partial [Fimbriimonadaceae bacterium]|nr:DUF4142 domain-containing protein [Fimbriimonadaceae bacterium]
MKTMLIAGAALLGVASAYAGQQETIRSHYNLSVASSANMSHIEPKSGVTNADRRFLATMNDVDRSEIALGRLAQSNGTGWARGFGADMVREHTMNLASLDKAAAQTGVRLPDAISRASQAAYSRLSKLHGEAFDAAYRRTMVQGHQQVLAKIQEEIRAGHNSHIRDYAVFTETAV